MSKPLFGTVADLRRYYTQASKIPDAQKYTPYVLPSGNVVDVIEKLLASVYSIGKGVALAGTDEKIAHPNPDALNFFTDIRFIAAQALHSSVQWGKDKNAKHPNLDSLLHLQGHNQRVWVGIQGAIKKSEYVQGLGLSDVQVNPFLTNPLYLNLYEPTILSGLIPIVQSVLYAYIVEQWDEQVETVRLQDLDTGSLHWDALKSIMELGAPVENVVENLLANVYQPWRLSAAQCALCEETDGLISFLAFSTSVPCFNRIVLRLFADADSKHTPILQALAAVLSYHDYITRPAVTGSFATTRFDFLLERKLIPLNRKMLFDVYMNDTTSPVRLVLRAIPMTIHETWEVTRSILYTDSFTHYIVQQLAKYSQTSEEEIHLFGELKALIEAGAPLPVPQEKLATSHAAYKAILAPWSPANREILLKSLARRRILFQHLPGIYQPQFVGLLIADLADHNGAKLESVDTEYYGNLIGLVNLRETKIANFSPRARWNLLAGFFRYNTSLIELIRSIKPLSSYTKSEIQSGLNSWDSNSSIAETKGVVTKDTTAPTSSTLITQWDQLVSSFGTYVTDPTLLAIWLPLNQRSDFAIALFLWALRASINKLHPLVQYLIGAKNVQWSDSFTFHGTEDRKAEAYKSSLLQVLFESIPTTERADIIFWQNHREAITHCLTQPGVHIPEANDPERNPEGVRHFTFILQAFDPDYPALWGILYSRHEHQTHVTSQFRDAYKEFCINHAIVEGKAMNFEILTDVGIFPNDDRIRILDNSRTAKVAPRYYVALDPGNTGWFRKFMNAVGSQKGVQEQLLKANEGDINRTTALKMAIKQWSQSRAMGTVGRASSSSRAFGGSLDVHEY